MQQNGIAKIAKSGYVEAREGDTDVHLIGESHRVGAEQTSDHRIQGTGKSRSRTLACQSSKVLYVGLRLRSWVLGGLFIYE